MLQKMKFSTVDNRAKMFLPLGYNPYQSKGDVICAKGKRNYMHFGNQQFRLVVDANIEKYADTKSRIGKSIIVNEILQTVREQLGGQFVRQDESGRWFDIGDDAAREKIGMVVRDQVLRMDPAKIEEKRVRRAAQKARRLAKIKSTRANTNTVTKKLTKRKNKEQQKSMDLQPIPIEVVSSFSLADTLSEYYNMASCSEGTNNAIHIVEDDASSVCEPLPFEDDQLSESSHHSVRHEVLAKAIIQAIGLTSSSETTEV